LEEDVGVCLEELQLQVCCSVCCSVHSRVSYSVCCRCVAGVLRCVLRSVL